eukprot:6479283-Amphidinium_carterae.2
MYCPGEVLERTCRYAICTHSSLMWAKDDGTDSVRNHIVGSIVELIVVPHAHHEGVLTAREGFGIVNVARDVVGKVSTHTANGKVITHAGKDIASTHAGKDTVSTLGDKGTDLRLVGKDP